MYLTEAEILRKGGKNTQKKCTKKDLHDPDNHNGVIIHLEPDILECEVKQALSSIQFSRSVMSNSLRRHESQHTRPPCPSQTPGVYSTSCPSP